MKRTYMIVASVLVMIIFLVGCNVGQAVKAPGTTQFKSTNKNISKINVTNQTNQTSVKANMTSNITKMNATLNASKFNATNVSFPRLNLTKNITSFNVTPNFTNISAGGNVSNFSGNAIDNKTNSTE